MTASPAPGPLAGILVADCSTVLAGPYATMLLGGPRGGRRQGRAARGRRDRGWGPPWVARAPTRTAAYYLAVNRNKRSLRLDLKAEAGREVLRRLLARADVLVENHRVGGFARLGFDDATLEALNPRLVHLAISGYGPTGPEAATPGYDFVVQAVSGLMSITGHPDADGGGPTKVGVAISDLTTGMLGATAVLAALAGRDRPGSPAHGRGQRIDISLLESTLAWLANQAQNLFVTGRVAGAPRQRPPEHRPLRDVRDCRRGDRGRGRKRAPVASVRGGDRCAGADRRPPLRDERRPRGQPRRAAPAHRGAAWRRSRRRPGWSAWPRPRCPPGPINDLAAAFASPQVAARGLLTDVEHPVLGTLRQVGPPFELHAHAGDRPDAAAAPRRAHRRDPRRARLRRARGGGDAGGRRRLTRVRRVTCARPRRTPAAMGTAGRGPGPPGARRGGDRAPRGGTRCPAEGICGLVLRVAVAGLEEAEGAAPDEVEGVGDDRVEAVLGHRELDHRALGGREVDGLGAEAAGVADLRARCPP